MEQDLKSNEAATHAETTGPTDAAASVGTETRAENPSPEAPQPSAAESREAEPETAEPAAGNAAELERELAEWKEKAEENYQRFLRAQADFENFRRRTRQEKEEFAKYASQKVLESLLPIIDNLERALAAGAGTSDVEALAKGVEMILRQMMQLLEREGVKPIEAVGKPFDPQLHEAVMRVEAEEGQEAGIVVEELQRGYTIHDKVLRPAMVKVSG